MLKKLLPVVLSIVALMAGAVGGELLRGTPATGVASADSAPSAQAGVAATGDDLLGTDPAVAANTAPPVRVPAADATSAAADDTDADAAWFRFPQQFFVPVLHGGHLDSTMILSLSVEMPETAAEEVYAHEIKLRDALLRQLMIHANTGGFDGNFTTEAHLRKLRGELTTAAQTVVPRIREVLIGDIARQER